MQIEWLWRPVSPGRNPICSPAAHPPPSAANRDIALETSVSAEISHQSYCYNIIAGLGCPVLPGFTTLQPDKIMGIRDKVLKCHPGPNRRRKGLEECKWSYVHLVRQHHSPLLDYAAVAMESMCSIYITGDRGRLN